MISINISGVTGSGKTTLAIAIMHLLADEEFTNVIVNDFDITHGCSRPDLQNQKLDAIKHRAITINTIQLSKNNATLL